MVVDFRVDLMEEIHIATPVAMKRKDIVVEEEEQRQIQLYMQPLVALGMVVMVFQITTGMVLIFTMVVVGQDLWLPGKI